MFTQRSREGYLLIDHSASPGLAPGFAGPGPIVGEGKIFETGTCTCSHCNGIVILNPARTRERARCSKCDRYICDSCGARMALSGECNPFLKLLDDVAEAAVRSNGGSSHV